MSSCRAMLVSAGVTPPSPRNDITSPVSTPNFASNSSAVRSSTSRRSDLIVSWLSGLTSRPKADMTPAPAGKTTCGIFSLRAIRKAWMGPHPPKAIMLQPR